VSRMKPLIFTTLAIFLFGAAAGIRAAEIARFDEGPFAGMGYPFSESARAGGLLFLAGQVGEDTGGQLAPGGIQAEAELMMLNIAATLGRRGLTMDHVVKCTVFLADIDEWGAFNEVYKRHFTPPYPARSAMAASGLVGGARVEMECIAAYPD